MDRQGHGPDLARLRRGLADGLGLSAHRAPDEARPERRSGGRGLRRPEDRRLGLGLHPARRRRRGAGGAAEPRDQLLRKRNLAPERRRHDDPAGPAAQVQHQRPGRRPDGGDDGSGLDRALGSGIQDRRRHRLEPASLAGRSQDPRATGHPSGRARGDRGHQRHPQHPGRGAL
ncbi:hypothetical protein D3C85_1094740 [compost metagenome]